MVASDSVSLFNSFNMFCFVSFFSIFSAFLSQSDFSLFFGVIFQKFPFRVIFLFCFGGNIHIFFFLPFVSFMYFCHLGCQGERRGSRTWPGISDIVRGAEIRAKHRHAEDIQAGQIEFLTKFANKLGEC